MKHTSIPLQTFALLIGGILLFSSYGTALLNTPLEQTQTTNASNPIPQPTNTPDDNTSPMRISTAVDPLPEFIKSSPYALHAKGRSILDNVTLFYRYHPINTTSQSHLEMLDTFRDGVDSPVFDYPNSIKVVGTVGYAVSMNDNSLVLINVTDPSALTELSHTLNPPYLTKAHDIAVSPDGNTAYTITWTAYPWVCIWDTTDKTTPPTLANQAQITSTGKGMYLTIDAAGHYLYACTTDFCAIYNITNKATHQLSLLAKFNTSIPPTTIRWHPYPFGSALYICTGNQTSTAPGDGVYIYNISDKTHPVMVNRLNSSAIIREFRQYDWHDFHYLIGFLQYKKGTYWTGALGIWNVSSGDFTYPHFERQVETLEADGTFTCDVFAIHNGYAFAQRKNYNLSRYTGITAYDINDIHHVYKVAYIDGLGAPNYLNLCHDIECNQNNIDPTIYVISQNSDSLTTIELKQPNQNDSWVKFETDRSFPWQWNFTFRNGTGFYEFYSIGAKNRIIEQPPKQADAKCNYAPPMN
jgi:hypothetical protein